jgi:hypothetical protein
MPAVLIVSSRNRLWQRYGPEGLEAIELAVEDLVDAMSERNLAGTPVYTDDSPLLTNFGILPADSGQPSSVSRVLNELAERCGWLDEVPRYVLIIGDDDVVPFYRLENPSPDADTYVLSDHPYAVTPSEPLRPRFAVGRIPAGGLSELTAAIRAAAEAHRRLARGGELPLPETAFGFSASVWKRAARSVFDAIGDPKSVRLSPPLMNGDAPAPGADGPRFRYYNLHGLSDSADWFGQRDPTFPADYPFFPVALRTEDIQDAPGSLVFSEACYGAHVQERATHDSIALTSLSRGALAFVGATGVAYGGLDGPLVSADLLAHRFWSAVLEGLPVGRALSRAKAELAGEAHARQGFLDAEDEKAIYNFVLYGDPSLVHRTPSVWAENAAAEVEAAVDVEWAGPAAMVGTLPVQPHTSSFDPDEMSTEPGGGRAAAHEGSSEQMVGSGVLAEAEGAPGVKQAVSAAASRDLAQYVEKVVTRRMPEFEGADVHVALGRVQHGLSAKGGATSGERRTYVVTLVKSLPMCSGKHCSEIVRVTVGGDGRIRKVAVSR